ncbi:basal body-orientation factor 1-like [Poeciliopsis prolifica]|uniref:basal body-orientation factor 1-like n=1 Tax=Poeciliopsis prolifica TaxID=188132 RepID=UPI002413663B|nr:basal body-orientation factor 1-like [Poeciliopsis prolifica]
MAPRKGKKKKKPIDILTDQILMLEEEKKRMALMYETSTKLWESKLKRAEQDLAYHQKELGKKNIEAEQVKNSLFLAEKCNFGVTDYWIKELKDKTDKINVMEEKLKTQEETVAQQKLQFENEKKRDFKKFEEEMLKSKATEARVQKKMINIRKQMQVSQEEYRQNIKRRKEKYSALLQESKEKEWNFIRKEMEMNQFKIEQNKITAELESQLSIVNKEKKWLIENLKFTLANLDEMRQLAQSLTMDKLSLAVDRNILTSTLKNNICEMECDEKKLAEAMAKAASLEQALKKMEEEKTENEKRYQVIIQASQVELDKLQKIIAMREKEICQVKKLARTIVEKRKDMEAFFHEALDNVRQEISDERKRNAKEAYEDYRQKFRDGTEGKGKFPLIRIFDQSPNSTNSVYSDKKTDEKWPHLPGKEVYMSDLTWEQKEKVLILLFAKMNGDAERASQSSTMRFDHHFRNAGWLHRRGLQHGGFVKVV